VQTPATRDRSLVTGAGVSGSSPLVGSQKSTVLQVNSEDNNHLLMQAGRLLIPLRNRTGEMLGYRTTPCVRSAEGLGVPLVGSRRAHARHGTEGRTRGLPADGHGWPMTAPTTRCADLEALEKGLPIMVGLCSDGSNFSLLRRGRSRLRATLLRRAQGGERWDGNFVGSTWRRSSLSDGPGCRGTTRTE
jgi:hypothetical protein